MSRTVFNSNEWSAHINIKEDGTFALVLPKVAGHCPNGRIIHFAFDSAGIQNAIEALMKHSKYINTPFKKASLPPSILDNIKNRA